MAVAHHPLVQAFFTYKLLSRSIFEDGSGEFYVREVRREVRSGERLRLTYPLDTLHKAN